MRCGAYAVKWAIGLAEPCRGGPSNPSQRRVLGRLRAGRHPRTNARIGQEALMEVPGLGVMGDSFVQVLEGMSVARGRTTTGYLRRPGGAEALAEGGGTLEEGNLGVGVDEEVERGPRAELRKRHKVMALRPSDLLEGEENARKRRRAHEARREDAEIMEGLMMRMRDAMETHNGGAPGGENVLDDEGAGGQVESGARCSGRVGGDEGSAVNRKELLTQLRRAAEKRRRELADGRRIAEEKADEDRCEKEKRKKHSKHYEEVQTCMREFSLLVGRIAR